MLSVIARSGLSLSRAATRTGTAAVAYRTRPLVSTTKRVGRGPSPRRAAPVIHKRNIHIDYTPSAQPTKKESIVASALKIAPRQEPASKSKFKIFVGTIFRTVGTVGFGLYLGTNLFNTGVLFGVASRDRLGEHNKEFVNAQILNALVNEKDKNEESLVGGFLQRRRLANTGNNIVKATKVNVEKMLVAKYKEIRESLPAGFSCDDFAAACQEDPEAMFLSKAYLNLAVGKWDFIVVPNRGLVIAFVSSGRSVFMTSGMLSSLIENDDELALVLAHEVAHVLRQDYIEGSVHDMNLRMIQIGLFCGMSSRFRPAAGVVGIGVVALEAIVYMLRLQRSRDAELEADRLGYQLAKLAGYDPEQGVEAWQRMPYLMAGLRKAVGRILVASGATKLF